MGRPKKYKEDLVKRQYDLPASLHDRIIKETEPQSGYPDGRDAVEIVREALQQFFGMEPEFSRPATPNDVRRIVREEMSAVLKGIVLSPEQEAQAQQLTADDRAAVKKEMAEEAAAKTTKGSRSKKAA